MTAVIIIPIFLSLCTLSLCVLILIGGIRHERKLNEQVASLERNIASLERKLEKKPAHPKKRSSGKEYKGLSPVSDETLREFLECKARAMFK